MSASESDVELHTNLSKKPTKMPKSPSEGTLKNEKKFSTKIMIVDALKELNTRKGVSIYAIKKFIVEKYNVDVKKINYIIKKSIKAGVADGSIVQVKGIGASGSFKLSNVKEKVKKTSIKKPKKEKIVKIKEAPEKPKKIEKIVEKKPKPKTMKETKPVKKKTEVKMSKKKVTESTGSDKIKKKKVKKTEEIKTPAKKKALMMKRKSIGSIIKPPKMKPKRA